MRVCYFPTVNFLEDLPKNGKLSKRASLIPYCLDMLYLLISGPNNGKIPIKMLKYIN